MFLSVSHGFSTHCLEYILPASMNHMNGKVEYILTNVWGTNMNNKTIKPKLEMNLRSVVGGFNPSEKSSSVKQKVIPSTCSVPMKGQIRGSFGGAPHVIIWSLALLNLGMGLLKSWSPPTVPWNLTVRSPQILPVWFPNKPCRCFLFASTHWTNSRPTSTAVRHTHQGRTKFSAIQKEIFASGSLGPIGCPHPPISPALKNHRFQIAGP